MPEVYPGPWQDARIHVEYLRAATTPSGVNTVTLASAEPTTRSGWVAALIPGQGFEVTDTKSTTIDAPLTPPPLPLPGLSLDAFDGALRKDVGSGSAVLFDMTQSGAQSYQSPGGPWTQTQTWTFEGSIFRIFPSTLNEQSGSNEYSAPAGMPTSTDDYYIETEPPTAAGQVELLQAVVQPYGGADYKLFAKNADGGFPWLSATQTSVVIDGGPVGGSTGSIYNARQLWADGFSLAVPAMNDLASKGAPAGLPNWYDDPRLPALAVLYDGIDLENASIGTGFSDHYAGGDVVVEIRYRWPRWRQVFYVPQVPPTIPYRRTFPRDDALAGGAGRNYPPSRAVQSSNRTSGYL